MRKPFYGWVIVAVAFLIGITESGAFQGILSIFMKPMAAEFGWSRAAVTGAIAFGSILAGGVSPLVGPLLDRHGPRMAAFWGILFLSFGLVGMTFVDRIWQFYLLFGMGRMIAVGILSLVISVSVSNWFVRKRGRAIGITWLGPRFGSALFPVMVQFFIMTLGWRIAWSTLGVVVFVMSGIPALIFLRRRPEDMGLRPDGDDPPAGGGRPDRILPEGPEAPANVDPEPVWTRRQAFRTKTFWMLTGLHSLIPFVQAGINFHLYPFLTDQGVSPMRAVLILMTINLVGAFGSVGWGVWAEKIRVQRLLAVNNFGGGLIFLGLCGFASLNTDVRGGVVVLFLLAAGYGFVFGGRMTLLNLVWAEFFGRRSLGLVMGFSSPFRFIANALGPLFGGLCFDIFGNYGIPFCLFALILMASGFLCRVLVPPILQTAPYSGGPTDRDGRGRP